MNRKTRSRRDSASAPLSQYAGLPYPTHGAGSFSRIRNTPPVVSTSVPPHATRSGLGNATGRPARLVSAMGDIRTMGRAVVGVVWACRRCGSAHCGTHAAADQHPNCFARFTRGA